MQLRDACELIVFFELIYLGQSHKSITALQFQQEQILSGVISGSLNLSGQSPELSTESWNRSIEVYIVAVISSTQRHYFPACLNLKGELEVPNQTGVGSLEWRIVGRNVFLGRVNFPAIARQSTGVVSESVSDRNTQRKTFGQEYANVFREVGKRFGLRVDVTEFTGEGYNMSQDK